MTSNSDLALVGASGVGWTAALGSTGPTDFSALNGSWSDFGYISQDGLTKAVALDSKEFVPWGNLAPIRRIITKKVTTFKFTVWETNKVSLGLYYAKAPAAVIPDPGTGIIAFTEQAKPAPDRRAFCFDVLDGATNLIRHYIAEGEVTEIGDIVYKTDDLIGYPMTVTAYPASDGNSIHHFFKLAGVTS